MMILTTKTSLIHAFLTLPIVCRNRFLYLAVSALRCVLVIDVPEVYSAAEGLYPTIDFKGIWGQTYNIGPYCNYSVDLYKNNYILC